MFFTSLRGFVSVVALFVVSAITTSLDLGAHSQIDEVRLAPYPLDSESQAVAIDRLEGMLSSGPDAELDPAVFRQLARLRFLREEVGALRDLQHLADRTGDANDARFVAAYIDFLDGNYASAAQAYAELVESWEESASRGDSSTGPSGHFTVEECLRRWADCARALDRPEEAEHLRDRLLRRSRERARREIEAELETGLETAPPESQAPTDDFARAALAFRLAELHRDDEDWEASTRVLEAALVKAETDDAKRWLEVGLVRDAKGREQWALAHERLDALMDATPDAESRVSRYELGSLRANLFESEARAELENARTDALRELEADASIGDRPIVASDRKRWQRVGEAQQWVLFRNQTERLGMRALKRGEIETALTILRTGTEILPPYERSTRLVELLAFAELERALEVPKEPVAVSTSLFPSNAAEKSGLVAVLPELIATIERGRTRAAEARANRGKRPEADPLPHDLLYPWRQVGRALDPDAPASEVDRDLRALVRSFERTASPADRGRSAGLYRAASELAGRLRADAPREALAYSRIALDAAVDYDSASYRDRMLALRYTLHREIADIGAAQRELESWLPFPTASRFDTHLHLQLAQLLSLNGRGSRALEHVAYADATHDAASDDASDHYLHYEIAGIHGQILLDMGLTDQARRWFEESERRFAELEGSPYEATAAVNHEIRRANLRLAGNNVSQSALVDREISEFLTAEGLDISASQRASLVLRRALALDLRARATGEENERAELFRQVADDPEANAIDRQSATTRLVQVAIESGRWNEADERWQTLDADLLPDQDLPLESAFALALGTQLARRRAEASTGAEQDAQRALLRERLDRLESRAQAYFDGAAVERSGGLGFLRFGRARIVVSELILARLALDDDPESALERWIAIQAHGSLARRLGSDGVEAASLRATLDEGEVVLAYLTASATSHLFAITRDQVRHHVLDGRDAIEVARVSWIGELLQPPSGDASQQAERLKRLRERGASVRDRVLPAAWSDWLASHSRWTVTGLDLLGYVPFEALPNGDSWLGLDTAIAYWPALPVGVRLHERVGDRPLERPDEPGPLFLTAPEHGAIAKATYPHLRPLDFQEAQLAAMLAPYPSADSWTGKGATWRRLRAEESRRALWQVMAHGVDDLDRERSTGFVLAPSEVDDGLVWPEDLDRLEFPALTILAACGTARGTERWGDPAITDASGSIFLGGGNAVILPYANLSLRATERLLAEFHPHLAEGATPAEALRAARRTLAEQPATADPFYWALLHAHGLGHRPIYATEKKTTSTTQHWAIMVGLLLIAIAVWRTRQRQKAIPTVDG